MERIILVEHLVKNFEVSQKGTGLLSSITSLIKPEKRLIKAVRDISFSVDEGEFIGFIGPNGAGKTTTLKALSGVLYPSDGFVQVAGFTPSERKPQFLKKIALVMGQKNQLWWDLPAMETFELNRAIYEIPKSKYKKTLEELVTLLEVGDLLKTQVRKLSLGQRMRLELIAALLHQPKVIFLDEPTIGLDVVAGQKVRDFLLKYNKEHKATILLTSHNMDDVSNLAKRVIVIDQGTLIFDGKLQELVNGYAKEKLITIYINGDINFQKLENVGKVTSISLPQVVISVPRNVATVAASELLQNFPVYDLTIEEEPIDNIIRHVFKRETGEAKVRSKARKK